MVVIVFRSRLTPETQSGAYSREYESKAVRMEKLASQAAGFISFKTFQADDGERVSLAEFDSEAAVVEWKANSEHREAQSRGREAFYSEYQVQICQVSRSYRFRKNEETRAD